MTMRVPAVELVDLLKSACDPCAEFMGACRDVARWAPHVNRSWRVSEAAFDCQPGFAPARGG